MPFCLLFVSLRMRSMENAVTPGELILKNGKDRDACGGCGGLTPAPLAQQGAVHIRGGAIADISRQQLRAPSIHAVSVPDYPVAACDHDRV
jgi:hypothetical protein